VVVKDHFFLNIQSFYYFYEECSVITTSFFQMVITLYYCNYCEAYLILYLIFEEKIQNLITSNEKLQLNVI